MNAYLPFTGNAWVFGIAIGLALALFLLLAMRVSSLFGDPLRRRLRQLRHNDAERPGAISAFGTRMAPRNAQHRATMSALLVQAGWRRPHALALIYALRLILMLLLPLAAALLLVQVPKVQAEPLLLTVIVAATALIGWALPEFVLRRAVAARQLRLLEAFPDALDLLVACTEAGLGLNAAIERVSEQLPARSPELAAELALINSEIRAGVDRMVALRNLADRTGLRDIRGLVSLLVHSMRFGTSVASTLRLYADEFRDRRLQRAEEAAATVGTKLIFPLVFCVFPSFFVIAIGPAVIGVIRALTTHGVVHP